MDAQSENNLLKRKHYETNQKDINLKEKVENFSTSSVHALKKPLYSSFFINNKQVDSLFVENSMKKLVDIFELKTETMHLNKLSIFNRNSVI